jgi:hypothetical protein
MNKVPACFVVSPGPHREMVTFLLALILLLVGNASAKADLCRPGPFGFRPREATELSLIQERTHLVR